MNFNSEEEGGSLSIGSNLVKNTEKIRNMILKITSETAKSFIKKIAIKTRDSKEGRRWKLFKAQEQTSGKVESIERDQLACIRSFLVTGK